MKEDILKLLKKVKKPLDVYQIQELLEIESAADLKEVIEVLQELNTKGILHRTKKDRYMLIEKLSSLKFGYLHIIRYGDGKVQVENDGSYLISKENLKNAIDGDFVEIDVQDEARVMRVVKRDLSGLVGEIVKVDDKLEVKLDDRKKDIKISLTPSSIEHCVEGHKVVINILEDLKNNCYLGEVSKVLGHKNDPGVDILSIAAKHEINLDFSDATKEQLKTMPTSVLDKDFLDRKDLRNEVIFTIDGDDTKDIDDAISIKKDGDGYILGVHIADVSHYVKEDTPLFNDAKDKGTSSYLADTVLPMLPHELSNGICSLNEGVDRLAISCIMYFDKDGKKKRFDVFPSVINSKKKMTYNKVNEILLNNNIPEGYEKFADDLYLMNELSKKLGKIMHERGSIEFFEHEGKIVQNENGKAIDVVRRFQKDGEVLIENFMIAANETIAAYIYNMDLPFVYRIEGAPNSDKLTDFGDLLKALHINAAVNTNSITSHNLQAIIENIKNYSKYPVLSSYLLRCMQKAIYSPDNIGHYGLGSKTYTHFTSPIRRFPDLMVHTLLKKYIFELNLSSEVINYYEANLPQMCDDASLKERASDEAEREVFDMKCAEYMEDYVGYEYEGVITSITGFGVFVELPNLVEGLIPLSKLEGKYQFNSKLYSLIKDNKIEYTVGDHIKVVCIAASKEKGQIDFMDVKKLQRTKEKTYGNK